MVVMYNISLLRYEVGYFSFFQGSDSNQIFFVHLCIEPRHNVVVGCVHAHHDDSLGIIVVSCSHFTNLACLKASQRSFLFWSKFLSLLDSARNVECLRYPCGSAGSLQKSAGAIKYCMKFKYTIFLMI
ncbi:unnamed protein product [Moneuplotes crassus]|uniref:Uncharacterized protein n=1 Tax=Euplotes crassus TaxID=5936 RepID=A0AAD1UDN4_EUPCR|nr:unnamed protein product [Moneuplotes crassus]